MDEHIGILPMIYHSSLDQEFLRPREDGSNGPRKPTDLIGVPM